MPGHLKTICGIVHVRKRCYKFKEMVWFDKGLKDPVACGTCMKPKPICTTNSETRIVKSMKGMS